mgnify:CR=1 FL=1
MKQKLTNDLDYNYEWTKGRLVNFRLGNSIHLSNLPKDGETATHTEFGMDKEKWKEVVKEIEIFSKKKIQMPTKAILREDIAHDKKILVSEGVVEIGREEDGKENGYRFCISLEINDFDECVELLFASENELENFSNLLKKCLSTS